MTSRLVLSDSFLWAIVWQSTACLLAGAGASFFWRRWPARAHRALLLAIVASVITPSLTVGV